MVYRKSSTTCKPPVFSDKGASGGINLAADLRGRRALTCPVRPGLVIVDAQKVFLDPISPARLPCADPVVANILLLTATFRALGHPVLFTRHVEDRSEKRGTISKFFERALTADDPLSELLPIFTGHATQSNLLTKNRHDAFSQGLPDCLQDVDILFIAGVQTHLCILSTALGLARFDMVPAVIGDACTARDRVDHNAAIRCLAGGHAYIRSTDEVLRQLRESSGGTDND